MIKGRIESLKFDVFGSTLSFRWRKSIKFCPFLFTLSPPIVCNTIKLSELITINSAERQSQIESQHRVTPWYDIVHSAFSYVNVFIEELNWMGLERSEYQQFFFSQECIIIVHQGKGRNWVYCILYFKNSSLQSFTKWEYFLQNWCWMTDAHSSQFHSFFNLAHSLCVCVWERKSVSYYNRFLFFKMRK